MPLTGADRRMKLSDAGAIPIALALLSSAIHLYLHLTCIYWRSGFRIAAGATMYHKAPGI